jgi:hypothetical protein
MIDILDVFALIVLAVLLLTAVVIVVVLGAVAGQWRQSSCRARHDG